MKNNPARSRLLEATLDLLKLQGYHGTGISEILKLSQTPKGSLYHYFPKGKDELVMAALTHESERRLNAMEAAIAESVDLLDALDRIIAIFLPPLLQSNFQKASAVASVALDTAATHPNLQELCSEIFAQWEAVFLRLAVYYKLDPDRHKAFARMCMTHLQGGILLGKVHKDERYLQYMLHPFAEWLPS